MTKPEQDEDENLADNKSLENDDLFSKESSSEGNIKLELNVKSPGK